MLQCPLCHLALRAQEEHDVEIDICDTCHGVWLDHGELQVLSNGRDFAPHDRATEDLPDLRCPRCDTQRFVTMEVEEGTMAQCAECHGLFVRGETVEFVTRSRHKPAPRRYSGVVDSPLEVWLWADLVYILGDLF